MSKKSVESSSVVSQFPSAARSVMAGQSGERRVIAELAIACQCDFGQCSSADIAARAGVKAGVVPNVLSKLKNHEEKTMEVARKFLAKFRETDWGFTPMLATMENGGLRRAARNGGNDRLDDSPVVPS